MPEVISNTSPLQYLHQLGILHLLPEFYGQVLIPTAVADELQAGLADGVALPAISDHPWIRIEEVTTTALPLLRDIHRGETEVLALAGQHPGSLLLLDDGPARRHARAMGLRITGTAGILLRATQRGNISALQPILEHLDALGFHLDQQTRAHILKLAGE